MRGKFEMRISRLILQYENSSPKRKRRQERGGMKTRLVIDGNAVYEIDEECEACRNGEAACTEKKKRIGKTEKSERKNMKDTES